MKILYLNPLILYPPFQGNQMTGLNRIKILSKHHEITLVCFYNDKSQIDSQVEKLKKYCNKIIPVYLPKWKSVIHVALGFIFSKKPLQVLYYYSGEMKRLVQQTAIENYDIIHVNTLRMEQFIDSKMQNTVLMDLHDSMILNVQSRLNKEKGLYKFLYAVELKRIKKYEDYVVQKYPHLMVLAEQDKKIHHDNSKITVIHLGVDTDIFKRYLPVANNKSLIFSGNMSYTPNINAVVWFIENCWQQILQQIPGVIFKIVGANPGKQIEKYRSCKGIEITGKVESMAEALNKAQVAIAPLKSGSGMQNKILEAMACSLPVVCSSIGLGDINAVNGESILVADEADNFAQLCIELLENPEKCKLIGQNALTIIEKFYSIQYHGQELEELYKKIIREKNNNNNS